MIARVRKLFDKSSPRGAVLRGALLVFIARGLGIGIAFAFQVLLARWAGAYEYGLFAFAWTWMIILGQVAPLGLNEAVLRFIPADSAHGQWGRVKALSVTAPILTLLFAAVGSAAAIALLLSLPALQSWEYRDPMLWALICTPFLAVLVLNEGLGRALGSVLVAYVPRNLAHPLLILLIAGGMYAFLGGFTAHEVLIVSAVTAALLMIIHCVLIARQVPPEARTARAEYQTRSWLRVSLPLGVVSSAVLLSVFIDPIIVGLWLSPEDLAVYQAASRTAQLLLGPQLALSVLTAPMIARMHATQDNEELRKLIANYTHWGFWPCALGCVLFVVFGQPLLGLFGPGFVSGYEILVVLSLGYLLSCAFGPLKDLMTMTGHHDRCALLFVLGTLLIAVLVGVAVPLFGLIGAAIAKVVGLVLLRVWLMTEVYRRAGHMPLLFATGLGRRQPSAT